MFPMDRRKNDTRPWWATFIVNVGVPAAIALFLVWRLTSNIEQRVSGLERITAQTLQLMNNAGVSMHEFSMREAERENARDRLLRQICINTSKPTTVALCGQ